MLQLCCSARKGRKDEEHSVFERQRAEDDRARYDDDRPRGALYFRQYDDNAHNRTYRLSHLRIHDSRGMQIHKKQEDIFFQYLFSRFALSGGALPYRRKS